MCTQEPGFEVAGTEGTRVPLRASGWAVAPVLACFPMWSLLLMVSSVQPLTAHKKRVCFCCLLSAPHCVTQTGNPKGRFPSSPSEVAEGILLLVLKRWHLTKSVIHWCSGVGKDSRHTGFKTTL
jgi:hypothetical protein